MSKDIIKKPATGVSKWLAKETLGNFIYDQVGLFWRSAVMTAFVAACLRLFSGIPLDVWLIIALFLVALIVFVLDRIARRRGWVASSAVDAPAEVKGNSEPPKIEAATEQPKCPYELVHRIADHQAKAIRDFVSVSRVAVWEHKLNDPVPTIKWGFMVKNRSLFPIDLVEVRNNLFFEKIELAERRFDDVNEVQQLSIWREGSVVFAQRLSGPEAQFIKNTPDGKFRFNRLIIKVGNRNRDNFPPIEPQELEIGDDLEATLNEVTYKETKGMVSLRQERDRLIDELQKATGADAKLTFEIDRQSQVHTIGGGTAGRRITANIRLRCMKTADHPMAIREFHAALLKENGAEKVIVPQEGALVVMGHPDMKIIDFANGWTIAEPLTDYRWFMFYLDITEQQLELLSHDYFMRITMVAVGQKPLSVDFDVDNWYHARTSNSYITVRSKDV